MVALAEAFVRVRPSIDKQEFRRETEKALRGAGGNIKVGIDGSKFRSDLTVLRAEIGKLRGKDLTIGVDVTKAYVDVVTLREEVDKLGRQRPTVRPDVDATTAFAKVAALAAGMGETRTQAETLAATIGATAKSTADFGDAADEAKQKTTGLGEETRKTKDHTTGLGDETDKTRTKVTDLAAEFHKTRDALAAMGAEFRKTGQIDVDQFKSLSSKLRDLESVGKAAGSETGKSFSAGLQGALKTPVVGPAIAVAIAGAITLGAPVIGAAVTAAVGGGAIAGGILLAAKDPRVGAAWSKLGKSAMAGLSEAADPFVDPLVRGAERFDATLRDILPSIRGDFAAMAPIVDRLVDGVSGMVVRMMPGIDALVREAGPTLTMLAGELPQVGAAFSSMFESIAAGGEGGKQALHDLLVLTEGMIVSTGKTIEGFEKLYQLERATYAALAATFTNNPTAWDNAGKQMLALKYGTEATIPVAGAAAEVFKRVAAAIVPVGREASLTVDQFKVLSGQINTTLQTSDVLAGQMVNKLFTSMMTIDQATLGVAMSQTRLSESIKENGRSLDIHTAKGQANTSTILAGVTASMLQYQANIAAGMSAGDAATAYDANTRALEAQLRAAGFTQGAIDGLIGKYRGVPSNVNTTIATQGLTTAIGNLDDLIRKINNIPTRRDIYITEHLNQVIRGGQSPDRLFDYPLAQAMGGIVAYAHGGIRQAQAGLIATAPTVLFGERGTGGPGRSLEGYLPAAGIPRDRAQDLLSTMGDWWGFALVDQRRLAMRDGGLVTLARTLSMDSGFGVLAPGSNLVHNGTGAPEPIAAVRGGPASVRIVGPVRVEGEVRLDEYSIGRVIQGLLTRPNRVVIDGPNDLGLSVAGWTP